MAIRQPITGNIVQEYKIGGTTIKVCDASIRTSQKDIDQINQNITRIGWKIVQEARTAGKDI